MDALTEIRKAKAKGKPVGHMIAIGKGPAANWMQAAIGTVVPVTPDVAYATILQMGRAKMIMKRPL